MGNKKKIVVNLYDDTLYTDHIPSDEEIYKRVFEQTGIDLSEPQNREKYILNTREIMDDGQNTNIIGTTIELNEIKEVGTEDIPIPEPEPDPGIRGGTKLKPEPVIEDDDMIKSLEELEKEKIQDMLDKYYGNREKEKRYRERLKAYKSHIVEREGKDGKKYKTVENYDGKKQDEDFLQLEEFPVRLERLSRYEQGDGSYYKGVAEQVYDIKLNELQYDVNNCDDFEKKLQLESEFKALKEGKQEFVKNSMGELARLDDEYLCTYNYAFNQHQQTQGNLKTLGKYGELVPYSKMPKNFFGKIGIGIVNGAKALRNVRSYIYKGIGTGVIAPVHKIMFDPDKKTAGLYKGLMSHRYEERKIYFKNKYLNELARENNDRINAGQKERKPSLWKMAFGIRIDAVLHAREGNIAVLNAGAQDVKRSVARKAASVKTISLIKQRYKAKEATIAREIIECQEQKRILENAGKNDAMTKKQMEVLSERVSALTAQVSVLGEEQKKEVYKNFVGIDQTDAIALSTHNARNSQHITEAVTCINLVAKAAVGHFISKKGFKKTIEEQTTRTIQHPEQVVEKTVTEPGKITKADLENVSIKDCVEASNSKEVSYYGNGGNTVDLPQNPVYRGFGTETPEGYSSASDGNGFDIFTRTDGQENYTGEENVFEEIAELYTKKGISTTTEDIYTKILTSDDPAATASEIVGQSAAWLSDQSSGMPKGWYGLGDGFNIIMQDITKPINKIVKEVIPAYTEYTISTAIREVLNGRTVAAMFALGLGGMKDLNEVLRKTKTAREQQIDGTKKQVSPWAKNNKARNGARVYDNNEFGFTGDKKGDKKSRYNEADIKEKAGLKSKDDDGYTI